MTTVINLTTPVARIVRGSLYKANTTDSEGKPLVIKNGPHAGQPRTQYFFAIAIPKGQETHWSQTPWGQQLWNLGHQCFPGIAQQPTFAWKIDDGDSQIPNMNNRRNCDSEGYQGNWIMRLSNGFAPRVFRQEGTGFVQETQVDYVKPGYFVEVAIMADGNGSKQQPGIYLNPTMVCFRAYGPEISFGPDVNEAGFGAAPLPPGASQAPLASTAPPPVATVPQPTPPPAAAAAVAQPVPPPAAAAAVAQPTPPPPPPPVQPDPGFLNVRKMTPKAGGIAYESYIAQGWNDQQLIQLGFMLP